MNLTIRNLTIHPIELTTVERFDSEKVPTGNVLSNVTGSITGFFNATGFSAHHVVPKGPGRDKQAVSVRVEPFRAVETDIRAPAADTSSPPRREVLRLTFSVRSGPDSGSGPGSGSDGTLYRYDTDVPSPSRRSATMKKLSDDAPHELTAVYVPSARLLAVFSSARLDSWMRELHDDWPLPLLSIPGTHNSPTCHTSLPSVRCQSVGVPEQLRNGVRFLDVRVSVSPDDDALPLVHSAFPVALTGTKYFADMLADVYRFLDDNPSEVVLMSIKREGTGKGSDQHLSRYLKHSYVDRTRHRWWTEPRIPVLGRARGRIVVVRRFALDDDMSRDCWDGRGWGIDALHWPDNCEDGEVGGGFIRVQDFYDITESHNIEKKIAFSHGQLERAAECPFHIHRDSGDGDAPDDAAAAALPPFFVNFLSASNFFNASCWPERIAAKVNPAIVEYLCARHGEDGKGPNQLKVGSAASTGIVVTDWVGANDDWDLIRCIVGMNARLQLPRAQ